MVAVCRERPSYFSIHVRRSFSETIRHLSQAHEKAALDDDTAGDHNGAASTPPRFDLWGEAYYTSFDNGHAGSKRDGHSFIGYIGTDYRISDSLLIGTLIQFDSTKETSGVLASKVDGEGWMVGPYISAQLHRNIFLDLRAAAGRSSNNLDIAGVTGSFDTVRWMVTGGLSGDWREGPWRFTPMTHLAYIEEKQERFTDSSSTVVPDQHVSLGRMTFGPEIGYGTRVDDTVIEPYGSIKGVWNFDRSDSPIINGQSTGTGSFWGQLGIGVDVLMPANTAFRVGLVYDGLGASSYQSLTAQGQLSIPLN